MQILNLIGRENPLFKKDVELHKKNLQNIIAESSFLVLGGAGSIGQACTKEIFKQSPKKLHVVDISENNLTELVRDIRSSYGYIKGEFQTYALDIGSKEYDIFWDIDGSYDYILNLSALKHVRSEKDPFTLMRMVNANIFNTNKTLKQANQRGVKKYFCVSTDKATNPVNMMGASKRIMEMFVTHQSQTINVSMARFANVAFSDGSLLHSFRQRLIKNQPIVAPADVKRYFITPKESGELCLLSCILGKNRDIFFPKLDNNLHLTTFSEIAKKFVLANGYQPFQCESEDQARQLVKTLPKKGKWPCLYTVSDTTGEKAYEEFYTQKEVLDLTSFETIGIIKNEFINYGKKLSLFENTIQQYEDSGKYNKQQLVDLFHKMIPDFNHIETGKYLDSKM